MRRARINDSLNELKTLVLDLLNKDVSKITVPQNLEQFYQIKNWIKLQWQKIYESI